ncbi:carbon catabolite repressor protein 4 homolog 3 isoform X2 [Juglans microcarpa x Juglans regia]|uniref:carbon catabolite repressor protein 4 homolog 3 isoform X2 n=1 Tax=Juglans microcarpa x Juglans regia TaxID=2249226 RepID=UPI001B7DCB8F|nr:carbon catabolite repressor protein 4 homolog 3 isoform X2 [Juglans microcarpa x Juglans regia]
MGFEVSAWLRARPPVAAMTVLNSASPKRHPLFFSFLKPTISCCTSGSAESSPLSSSSLSNSHSYSRRWCSTPISRRPLDQDVDDVRDWVEADQPLASPDRLTIVSYNILGDRNASKHRDLYSNVPPFYMNWERRKKVICKELMGWNPDIICLQEVDRYYELSDILVKAGYAGSYKRRTGDAADGCAMFWKADEFRLLEGQSIEFKEFGLRDNVAQLSVFEMRKDESRRLLVGNIHVLYNPSRGDVKLGQIRFLLLRAQILSAKWGDAPLVLAGDFNSTPQSAIYKFLSSSKLNILFYDRRNLSGQRSCHPAQVLGLKKEVSSPFIIMNGLLENCWTEEEVEVATGDAGCHVLVHPLKLSSSYATVKGSRKTRGSNGEPLATSYHSKFLGTVDYLWYSDGLVPTKVLDIIPFDSLHSTGSLPCKVGTLRVLPFDAI